MAHRILRLQSPSTSAAFCRHWIQNFEKPQLRDFPTELEKRECNCLLGLEMRFSLAIVRLSWGDIIEQMRQDLDRILIDREKIRRRVEEIGREITAIYSDDHEGLVIVPVLAGSIIFLADLIRTLPFKMKISVMTVSRYRGATTTGGATQFVHDLTHDIRGRHVLIVDDILDSGTTLRMVSAQLQERGPASLRTCVLLRKTARAPKDLTADFVGFDIEDSFVVGYGLDYDGHYRNLPDIAVLRPELYE